MTRRTIVAGGLALFMTLVAAVAFFFYLALRPMSVDQLEAIARSVMSNVLASKQSEELVVVVGRPKVDNQQAEIVIVYADRASQRQHTVASYSVTVLDAATLANVVVVQEYVRLPSYDRVNAEKVNLMETARGKRLLVKVGVSRQHQSSSEIIVDSSAPTSELVLEVQID